MGGSANNNALFSDTLAAGSAGFPIFQFYEVSTCSFLWHKYLPLNLESSFLKVVVKYRSDYLYIAFGFISNTKTLTLGQMSPTGTLNKLWESSFASSTYIHLYDLYYDENNND